MAKNEFNFEINSKISGQLAFSVILILSFLVALFSISAGEKIVKFAEDSPEFNIQKRIEKTKVNSDSKSPIKKSP